MSSPKLAPLHQAAQVHYRASVIDAATGRTVRSLPRKKNLILDQGLDGIAVRTWAASFTHAAVGTGTEPTKRDSGAVTVSQSGTTLTASAGFFVADDVGRLFKFDTGEEVRITVYTSGTSVEVATAATVAAAEGTVWYVNQTALETETKRTGTYGSEAGDNGTTIVAGTFTMKRTFIFGAESGTVTYREIGWSHTASAGANLFGRDLLAGSGVTLVAGQQLKVAMELSVTLSPSAPVPYVSVVAGWSHDGESCIMTNTDALATVGSAGNTVAMSALAFEPSNSARVIALNTESSAIQPITTGSVSTNQDIGRVSSNAASYTTGSFARTWTAGFSVGAANSANIRSIRFAGSNGGNLMGNGYRVLLDAPETKDSDHTLTLTFTLSWGRVLTN